jgi:hypothetical protein
MSTVEKERFIVYHQVMFGNTDFIGGNGNKRTLVKLNGLS